MRAVVIVVVAVALGACGSGFAPPDGDRTPQPVGQTELTTTTFTEPTTEITTTTESPQPTAEVVSVDLPGLPIGGNGEVVSGTLQCVHVNWSGPPDLPAGVRITITEVTFEPAGDFTLSTETCPGEQPPCLGSDYVLDESDQCVVPVAWTGRPTLEDERLLYVSGGVARCHADQQKVCDQLRDDILTEGGDTIPLDPAPSEFTTDTTDPTDGSNGSTGGPSVSSSTG